MPCSTENECRVELETYLFEFLYVEKVVNMDGGLIISVYGGNLLDWNDLGNKGVKGGIVERWRVRV